MDIIAALERIPIQDLHLHEAHEPGRLQKTCDSIRQEGMLRHPILATPMDGGYLVLDGAHRLASLRRLGCVYAPVQIIEQEHLSLSAWDHVVPDGEWLDHWMKKAKVRCVPEAEAATEEVVVTLIRQRKPYALLLPEGEDSAGKRLSLWRSLVENYSRRFKVIRLPYGTGMHPDEKMVCIRHVVCDLEEVMKTVMHGEVYPAGVTRFLVEGRLLNLCIPLTLMADDPSAQRAWEQSLAHWRSHLRCYTEKVYLCEASSGTLLMGERAGRAPNVVSDAAPILSAN
ncbi:ParB-like nuclease domain-containing protein [Laceyella tengchongensis]|uniref:ParB-like nuclease domain-containing protein n=1 Tax=Laceyella tengchongensis TaxID=574699 RepID=A0AA45WJD8_9BACL|nr:ParB N-terminal domain-containing protein [Laceyella tengchongensis]SMP02892.1 ParB-like nuclease domain-containing protein [Laceyella tengchongensis]